MLIHNLSYYTKGAINLAKAKWSLVTEGKVDKEVTDFRKRQCKSCPLFSNGVCNRNFFSDGESLIGIDRVAEFEQVKSYGQIVQIKNNNKIYTLGCGCFLFNEESDGKVVYHFSDELLEKTDGTAPCPLNRWTKKEFENYVNSKSYSRDNVNDKS